MSVVISLSLLHFLWQGALIGGAAWLLMRIMRTPSTRYLIGVVALALMAAAPLLTSAWLRTPSLAVQGPGSHVPGTSSSQVLEPVGSGARPGSGFGSGVGSGAGSLGPTLDVNVGQQVQEPKSTRDVGPGTRDLHRFTPRVSVGRARLLLAAWLIGVTLLSLRLSAGWWLARRLTRQSIRTPRLEILSNAERLMGALGITTAVTVVESALVQVPTVMGWIKPIVLLPAAAMSGLSMEQVNALIAHELAHVKRHDYLVNLAQSAIETLLFYHPMVWIISRRVREERELCCDDLAISVCNNDRLTYASALADLESLRQLPAPALAANGGSLLQRVKRILAPDDVQTVRGRGHWIAGTAILAITVALLGVQAKAKSASGSGIAQAVRGAVAPAVRSGAADGTRSGVDSSVRDAVPGALLPGSVEGSSVPGVVPSALIDGVTGGVEDQQVLLPGHMVRLEVMVRAAGGATSAQVAAMNLADARREWTRASIATQNAKAEFDRLARVRLDTPQDALTAAETVPGLATDVIVTGYVKEIEDRQKEIATRKASQMLADGHPAIVALNSEIAASSTQLRNRLVALVDAAKLGYERAKEAEATVAAAYALEQSAPSGTRAGHSAELSKDYTVQEDGTVVVPFAGRLKVAGLTIAAFERTVRTALQAKGIRLVSLDATLEGRASDASLFVLGEVKNPGAYPWRNGITFSHAVSMAGGVTDAAALDRAEIRVKDGAVARNVASVPASATIVVPPMRAVNVTVTGAVKKPGRVALTEERATLENAINEAGGLIASAGSAIRVRDEGATDWKTYRRLSNGSLPLEHISLTNNVVVEVPATPKVLVSGAVKSPGQYQWSEGLTLQSLLAMAGGPVANGALNRISVSTSSGVEKNAKMTHVITEGAEINVPERRGIKVVVRGAVRTPGVHVLPEGSTLNDALTAGGGLTANAGTDVRLMRSTAVAWQTYSKDDLYQGRLGNVELQADDIVDIPVASKFIVNGFVVTPGEYQWEPDLTLERAILKAGGVSPVGAKNRVQLRRIDPATQQYRDVDFKKEFKDIDRFSIKIQPKDIIMIPKRRI